MKSVIRQLPAAHLNALEKHRSKVNYEISRRGLGSHMNDTKWSELVAAIDTMPFDPPYQRKDILDSEPQPVNFDKDVTYTGDYHDPQSIYPFYSIEWIRIRPRTLNYVAALLPYKLQDCETQLLKSLDKIGQHYELRDESIWIYGYK